MSPRTAGAAALALGASQGWLVVIGLSGSIFFADEWALSGLLPLAGGAAVGAA